ncbi:MAG: PTS sugar transporter subunit IIA [Candidatus Binatia bacterium]
MIGIVVVTHGRLADEMLRTLRGVLGPLEQVEAVSAANTDDPERMQGEILDAIGRVETGDGSLILTDMFGDTATNLSLAVSRQTRCEVVAGVNMPMLVKAVTTRERLAVRELAALIHEYGRSHIFWASHGSWRAGGRGE